MKKSIVAATVAASTLGGAAAGATLLAPGFAGAQDEGDTTEQGESTTPSTDRLSTALQPLVDDGTLTESQRDAVIERLGQARADGELGRRGGHGFGRGFGADLTDVLGIEADALRSALQEGQSLADIATANGVDPQAVVDALVDAAEERVNAGVEAGRIDETRAAEILESASERANDIVNGDVELGRRGRGFRGFGGPATPDAGSDLDAANTSA